MGKKEKAYMPLGHKTVPGSQSYESEFMGRELRNSTTALEI